MFFDPGQVLLFIIIRGGGERVFLWYVDLDKKHYRTLFFKFMMHIWEIRVEGYETPYILVMLTLLPTKFSVCNDKSSAAVEGNTKFMALSLKQ